MFSFRSFTDTLNRVSYDGQGIRIGNRLSRRILAVATCRSGT